MNQKSNVLWRTLLITGLLAGTLDIIAAAINYLLKGGDNPKIILLYIASAVCGERAYAGGVIMLVLGLLFHYLIAYIWTFIFFWIYPRVKILSTNNKYINAIIYGIFVWLVMNLLVVPLSNASSPPFDPAQSLIGTGILILAIGLPVSLMASRYYGKL